MSETAPLLRTPLHDLHLELGARMVPFAGYEMPLQYPAGLMAEHLHTRKAAGLFDVSHMGQLRIAAVSGDVRDAALALETLIPVDLAGLGANRQRYGVLTNARGGIMDDLMTANMGGWLFVVVNAACKQADTAHIESALAGRIVVERLEGRALLALQGPLAVEVIAPLCPDAPGMRFMDAIETTVAGIACTLTRSGYTGEDGFEIGVAAEDAERLARALLADERVLPVGLGARDSLRLEAGLCLYGSDLDETTTPIEANLAWAIQKARRAGGAREGGYPGAGIVLRQAAEGVSRLRVGLAAEGRAPVRAHAKLFADQGGTVPVGEVTSGAFGPSVNAPVAMGYVAAEYSANGTVLFAELRGKFVPVKVAPMPFVAPGFKR
ncbi:glycine cleavage system aminomethyltransferase GcvT [Acidomonas methanolica]|uniref:aminomethyltransferase n=1 Tax=Acidomonas methanolica NBRC 104435 TaxID=1231351 RepID=A0A023D3L6_ACIMT|nr:glycine cleavage system aminomethyltransferase GcvT [Acidomonas methanolica]MBU2654182.1 glycine cleavage system aminomethyltransferase GcvT [Acidomonas methanolica]TCS30588.1 aminomethyltransferase [Acidomonas methanolica]GAJ28370.1 glycine cleavage system T protein/aminomethyltransferase [Acidomonas methanolica NBRC 104435]GEK98854.1 aminomethyltransferase [Acidomonas methanolica NBRC 104435]